jgi:hypothetical protein
MGETGSLIWPRKLKTRIKARKFIVNIQKKKENHCSIVALAENDNSSLSSMKSDWARGWLKM